MTKIAAILLMIAAIVVAAIYLITGRKLRREDVSHARGWKRHLLRAVAAVLAAVGVWGYCSSVIEEARAPMPVGQPAPLKPSELPKWATDAGSNIPLTVPLAWQWLKEIWTAAGSEREKLTYTNNDFRAIMYLVDSGELPVQVAWVLVENLDSLTYGWTDEPSRPNTLLCDQLAALVRAQTWRGMFSAEPDTSKIATLMGSIALPDEKPVFCGPTAVGKEDVALAARLVVSLITKGAPPAGCGLTEAQSAIISEAEALAAFRAAWRNAGRFPAKAAHEKALGVLQRSGRTNATQTALLRQAYEALCSQITEPIYASHGWRQAECYDTPGIDETVYKALGEAQQQLIKASGELTEMASRGKLSPAVIAKVRERIANRLQIASLSDEYGDRAAEQLAEAYLNGSPAPPPAEFAETAEILTKLLTEEKAQSQKDTGGSR